MGCAVEGCDRTDYRARGMCNAHYQRWWNHGDARDAVPIGYGWADTPLPAPETFILTRGEVETFRRFAASRIAANDAASERDRAREANDRQRYPWMFADLAEAA